MVVFLKIDSATIWPAVVFFALVDWLSRTDNYPQSMSLIDGNSAEMSAWILPVYEFVRVGSGISFSRWNRPFGFLSISFYDCLSGVFHCLFCETLIFPDSNCCQNFFYLWHFFSSQYRYALFSLRSIFQFLRISASANLWFVSLPLLLYLLNLTDLGHLKCLDGGCPWHNMVLFDCTEI